MSRPISPRFHWLAPVLIYCFLGGSSLMAQRPHDSFAALGNQQAAFAKCLEVDRAITAAGNQYPSEAAALPLDKVNLVIYPLPNSNAGDEASVKSGKFIGVIRNDQYGRFSRLNITPRIDPAPYSVTCIYVGTKEEDANARRTRLVSIEATYEPELPASYRPRFLPDGTTPFPYPVPHAFWDPSEKPNGPFITAIATVRADLDRRVGGLSPADREKLERAYVNMLNATGPWVTCSTNGCCKVNF